jgi:hypothetical protein
MHVSQGVADILLVGDAALQISLLFSTALTRCFLVDLGVTAILPLFIMCLIVADVKPSVRSSESLRDR